MGPGSFGTGKGMGGALVCGMVDESFNGARFFWNREGEERPPKVGSSEHTIVQTRVREINLSQVQIRQIKVRQIETGERTALGHRCDHVFTTHLARYRYHRHSFQGELGAPPPCPERPRHGGGGSSPLPPSCCQIHNDRVMQRHPHTIAHRRPVARERAHDHFERPKRGCRPRNLTGVYLVGEHPARGAFSG